MLLASVCSPLVNTTCSLSCLKPCATYTSRFCQNTQRAACSASALPFPCVQRSIASSEDGAVGITGALQLHNSLYIFRLPRSAPHPFLLNKAELGQALHRSSLFAFIPPSTLILLKFCLVLLSCPAKYLLAGSKGIGVSVWAFCRVSLGSIIIPFFSTGIPKQVVRIPLTCDIKSDKTSRCFYVILYSMSYPETLTHHM